MVHKFYNGKVILGNTIAPEGTAVYTDGERIVAVTADERPFDVGHDAGGKYISPRFIDIHNKPPCPQYDKYGRMHAS